MPNPLTLTLHALGAETASGSTLPIDLGLRNALRCTLDVEAITGAGAKLTVGIETSPTGTGGWKRVDSALTLTVATSSELTVGTLQRYARLVWTIEGTSPSIEFAFFAEAHQVYARLRDYESVGISKEALARVKVHDKIEALIAASDIADRYLCRQFTMPLLAWSSDLRRMVIHIAVYDLMAVRGFQPEGADELIVKRYDDAVASLREIGNDKACLPGVVDSSTPPTVSSDGDYDVAEVQPGVFFGAYPYGADAQRDAD